MRPMTSTQFHELVEFIDSRSFLEARRVAGLCRQWLGASSLVVVPDQPEHFVTFDDDGGWFVEHSLECRLSGTIGTCDYNTAIRNCDETPEAGRWRITSIDEEGLPSLEVASL